MDSTTLLFMKLYLPLILSILSLITMFLVKKGKGKTVVRFKPLGHFVDLEIPISNPLIVRIFLLLAAPFFLSFYLFYDYSSFFPQNYSMEVFYDNDGIRRSLEDFSPAEIGQLMISKNYQNYQQEYFDRLDTEVRKLLGAEKFFSIKEGSVHSTGRSFILVEKVSGWQKYYLQSSTGELTHILEAPDLPSKTFYTRFEKLPTRYDYTSLSLSDIVFRQGVVLHTLYKQLLLESKMGEEVTFKFSVVGVTKATFFPWPNISNTIYLADFGEHGLVPIGYAIYH